MRIRIEFDMFDGHETVNWYRDIADFPPLLRYQGSVYEFAVYDKSSNSLTDYTFNFTIVKNFKGKFLDVPAYLDLFPRSYGYECQCGAKHDKDFPNIHMFYCPKWKPIGEK